MLESKNCSRKSQTARSGGESRDNNVLIRSGEAPGVGWSRNMLYSGFNNLPRSVFGSAYLNGRSDNTDVMSLGINIEIFH